MEHKKFMTLALSEAQKAKEKGQSLNDMTLDEMEALWQEAKKA